METTTRSSLEEAIAQSEASMQLEGFDPKNNPVYCALRDDVLAGKIDFDEAVRRALAPYRAAASRSAA